ncbi:flagellar hook assembly protein FlgD [Dongshaea marina]|uniref:flagellar hook assembly protein FlgD n=1 Tax=Dongshaea marina TaxID=2047966 RepID=UPI000D3E5D07|nr:flagellar hook capping FlgD N-terminal domain-containing protein [Dongshaea marina]
MNTSVNAQNNTLLSADNTQQPVQQGMDVDENMFMTLMLAQLKNQDPTEPQDSSEFLSQLAQFSSVSSLQSLQKQVQGLAYGLSTAVDLTATSMVGSQVLFATDKVDLTQDGKVQGQLNLGDDAKQVTLNIYDEDHQLVDSVNLGDHNQGACAFTLDQSELKLKPGHYQISATATIGGEPTPLQTNIAARVDSVELAQNGIYLHLEGMGVIPIEQVTQITGGADKSSGSSALMSPFTLNHHL